MRRTNLVILTIIFALLSLISIIGVYYTHLLPTEEEEIITLCAYEQNGHYDYIAQLKSNNLYNKTILQAGEGILYIKITEVVNITFTYSFNCSLPANIAIQHAVNEYLESPKWPKIPIATIPHVTSNFSETTIAQFSFTRSINITAYDELKSSIDKETGTYASEFSLTIKPEIHVIANTTAGTINEPFTPNMTMNFRYRTPEGDYIAIEGLTHTQQGDIQKTETTYHPEVMNQRYASYAFSIVFISSLLVTARAYVKAKPKKPIKPEKTMEEIIAPYEETIFELAEEPEYETPQTTTVKMRSLEDLVSIADGLAKPVLHLKKASSKPEEKATHVFYVVDGSVIYEYEIIEPETSKTAGEQG